MWSNKEGSEQVETTNWLPGELRCQGSVCLIGRLWVLSWCEQEGAKRVIGLVTLEIHACLEFEILQNFGRCLQVYLVGLNTENQVMINWRATRRTVLMRPQLTVPHAMYCYSVHHHRTYLSRMLSTKPASDNRWEEELGTVVLLWAISLLIPCFIIIGLKDPYPLVHFLPLETN